jgi:2-polyprenyl-3-methyl-5-hydroxy-6-metoxy-1,4-benzoquinol methylase
MIKSKEWEWDKADKKLWLEPSEDGVYLSEKWKLDGVKSILDLGCGLGRHSILFAEKGFDVTAVDLSKEAIEYLEKWKLDKKLEFKCIKSDMKKLDFLDDTFDSIFSYHVISHSDTMGVKEVISEIRRVLKPEGQVFLTLCSKEHFAFSDNNIRIDENTILKTEGAEIEVPHFFADKKLIYELFSEFTLIKVRHITECNLNNTNEKERSHFYIEARNNK